MNAESAGSFGVIVFTEGVISVSAQDEYPLASLPLLGYSITIPSESENIHKDYVFKLHFKSHVYYFRSESEYTFERYVTHGLFKHLLYLQKSNINLRVIWCHRWMEVIRSATCSSSHVRTSRKEPHVYWPKREREMTRTPPATRTHTHNGQKHQVLNQVLTRCRKFSSRKCFVCCALVSLYQTFSGFKCTESRSKTTQHRCVIIIIRSK